MKEYPKGRRGFASMSPERVREIAKQGGHALPNEKRYFSTNREAAYEAGKAGGYASGRARKAEKET